MSKAPSMPMYWDAYLADTTHLTTLEHGAYLLLLAGMWRRNGYVPDDDQDNARILGLSTAKWKKMKARFADTISGFKIENGQITQQKLLEIWENTQEKISKNKKNGAKGGRASSSKNSDLDQANAKQTLKPNPSIPEPEPEPLKKEDTNVSLSLSVSEVDEVSEAVSAYNSAADRTGWPKVQKLSNPRRAAVRGRLKDSGGLSGWEAALDKAEASRFLRGEANNFRLSFDWLTKPANFTKLMEGNYDDRDNPNPPPSGAPKSSAHADMFSGFARNAHSRQNDL